VYEGYLAMDGIEVVNTHRAAAYAAAGGLSWVQGCSECSSVVAGLGGEYETPLLDAKRLDPPPWWDGSMDAAEFFGLIGVSVSNADDSTRRIEVLSGAAGSGHFGALRYSVRSLTVRAIAVAASDCALGYGLEWLRSIDAGSTCNSVTTEMYDCCPNVTQADCEDPECIDQCVQRRLRLFFGSRITQGPTVLRRREMNGRGAMAEVEFVITVTDPYIYSFVPAYAQAIPQAVLWEDPVQGRSAQPVDAFAAAVTYAAPPPVFRPEPRFLPRTVWERQEVAVPAPEFGTSVAPLITVESAQFVPSVRLTLSDASGGQVAQWRMEGFPTGGKVTLDLRARSVTTESNGIVRRNDAFVTDPSGGPARWPRDLPKGEYLLAVDRALGTDPLEVAVTVMGRVSP
jgi:hypothetical protein